jgi:hypothetical protein
MGDAGDGEVVGAGRGGAEFDVDTGEGGEGGALEGVEGEVAGVDGGDVAVLAERAE